MATLANAHSLKQQAAYEAEVQRMRDAYGPDAEIPHPPQTTLRPPLSARLAELAQQVAEAGHEVEAMRGAFVQAQLRKEQAEKRFISLSEALVQAIHEHREGTPENVPYGLR